MKCNFPMSPHVRLFVGRSVIFPKRAGGKLHFHVPIRALDSSVSLKEDKERLEKQMKCLEKDVNRYKLQVGIKQFKK